MKISKIALTALFGIAVIFTIYGLSEGYGKYHEIQNTLIRNLALDQTKIKNICDKANFTNGVPSYIMDLTSSLKNTTNSISSTINSNNAANAQLLIDYIKNGKQDDLTNYVIKRVSPYIIFLIFAVISIISWFVYFICCCCPCCCCSPKGCCCSGDTCPNISFFIALISYIGIIICCIIGFVFSAQFVKDVNSVTCQFLTFYSNTVEGQNITTTPKWVGVTGIRKIFADTSSALDTISQNSRTAFTNTNWTTSDPAQFENLLGQSYQKFSSRSLTNRNPAASKKSAATIVPLYISNYGTYTKANTLLNAVYQEFTTKIKYSITLIDQAKEYSKTISDNSQSIKDTITNIDSSLKPLSDAFTNLEKDVINQWIDYQMVINDSAVNGFLVIYAILAGISCLSIVFMIFYACCCKIQWFRYLLHLFWILTMIIMVLTFILGTVFGVIGLISTDGVSVIRWIFGTENLSSASPKVISDATASKYINICMNGNGDLASEAFGTSTGNSQYLDKLYNVSFVLVDTKNQINTNKNSLAVTSINSQLDEARKNIILTTDTSYNSDALVNQFLEWNAFTDSSVSGTYQRSCSSNTKDYWVADQKNCPASYTYLANGGSAVGSNSCLVLSEWSAAQVSSRYGAAPAGCGATGSSDFSTVSNAATSYFNAMSAYSTDNSRLIDEIKVQHTEINNSFTSMAEKLMDLLTKVEGIITPLVNIFKNLVGNSGLFQILNCAYMGKNIGDLLTIMNDQLSVSSTNLGAVVVAVSFLQYLSVFCILIVILRKKETSEVSGNQDIELGMKNH